jgi:hypothetical protein
MSELLPRDQYVALSLAEFREGYDTFSAGLAGELPLGPTFPRLYQDGRSGKVMPMPDTLFDRPGMPPEGPPTPTR